jgi:hypothetical protein
MAAHLLVVAVTLRGAMLLDEQQDVVDVDLDLLDQFDLEDDVVDDRLLLCVTLTAELGIDLGPGDRRVDRIFIVDLGVKAAGKERRIGHMSQNTRGVSHEPDSQVSNITPARPNHQGGAVDVNQRDRQALVDYFSILQEWSRTQDRRDKPSNGASADGKAAEQGQVVRSKRNAERRGSSVKAVGTARSASARGIPFLSSIHIRAKSASTAYR